MEEEWSVYDSMVRESGYDSYAYFIKFREVLKESKEYLLKLDSKKRLEIIRELLKNPNFDDTDVYYLATIAIQEDPSRVEPKKPKSYKIRFVMSGRKPTKPIREEEKAAKRTDKTGRKRLRSCSDCEFDEEEEKDRAMKTKKKKKKKKQKVNDFVFGGLPEKRPDLPAEFKERIQKLGGTKASLVIQKKLFPTDVSTSHKRLSIPWLQIEDKEFLSGEERAFLAKIRNENGAAEIKARVIGENGKEYEIGMRQWNTMSTVYNFVKGWNGVVSDHRLCKDMIVQLWSFRVEGKLGFALVKLGISEKANEKLGIS
ncbi:hypothetical protein Vadar_006883 [Vaccinium darrowii]|uniref:Uncharacterized protein n=1 Tax=Vaccinium darrowii TaxID=229202 RepID=A0ACB7XFT6_9ERIC|nr:hypothetical protein Vadar_006883 [Vaccinium darrowii]